MLKNTPLRDLASETGRSSDYNWGTERGPPTRASMPPPGGGSRLLLLERTGLPPPPVGPSATHTANVW